MLKSRQKRLGQSSAACLLRLRDFHMNTRSQITCQVCSDFVSFSRHEGFMSAKQNCTEKKKKPVKSSNKISRSKYFSLSGNKTIMKCAGRERGQEGGGDTTT